jgi:phosphoglycolate phosphatase
MSWRAILFDLDGTLIDTLDDLADATNRVLAAQGYPPHPVDAYRYFVGDGARRLIERALPETARTPANIDDCLAAFREDYGINWHVKTQPYPGIPALLDGLVVRGIHLGVLSNKPHQNVVDLVSTLLGPWSFDQVFGQREGVPSKPNPQGALEVARALQVNPAEVVFLGDSGVDMLTAAAAGMYPAGALWGFRAADELLSAGAQVLLPDPLAVLDLFDGTSRFTPP